MLLLLDVLDEGLWNQLFEDAQVDWRHVLHPNPVALWTALGLDLAEQVLDQFHEHLHDQNLNHVLVHSEVFVVFEEAALIGLQVFISIYRQKLSLDLQKRIRILFDEVD